MAESIHPQTFPFRTMTVRDLTKRLAGLDPDAPVIFKSPHYGCFGSGQMYSVADVKDVTLPRREQHYPAAPTCDDETGEEGMSEPYTQVWEQWRGVVIG